MTTQPSSPAPFEAAPVLSYGFKYGTSPQQEAYLHQVMMSKEQTELNKIGGRGKRLNKRSYKKHLSGGNADVNASSNLITIPQFPSYGPEVSPVGANSSSILTNTTAIHGLNDATNDCYATNTCKFGGKKRRSHKRKASHKKKTHKRKTQKHKRKSHKRK